MALGTVGPASGQSQQLFNALIMSRLMGGQQGQNQPLNQMNPLQVAALIQGLRGSPSGPASWPPTVLNQPNPNATAGVTGAAGGQSGVPATPALATQAPLNLATAPTAGVQGAPGTQSGGQIQAPLNQANPNTTYVSPNTPQPGGAPPVQGQPGTQSGASPGSNASLATAARNYRIQNGIQTSSDTDALNAESLAAAQAGRNDFNRTLASQYGAAPAAGVYGPATNVTNALTAPPTTAQLAQQSAGSNLLQQGLY